MGRWERHAVTGTSHYVAARASAAWRHAFPAGGVAEVEGVGEGRSSNLGSLKNTSCGLLPYGQRYPRARTVATVRREIISSLSVVSIPTWAPIRCA